MSETIADHGYIPEEHAPDPVLSHGDPSAPGKVAIWLFLASEIMFFIAMLGTYIVLRSGSPHLFSEHALALSKPLAGANTLVLIFSSLTMALSVDAAQKGNAKRVQLFLFCTLLCAFGFMGIKAVEYSSKFHHHTVVASATRLEIENGALGVPYNGNSKTKELYAIIHRITPSAPAADQDAVYNPLVGKFEKYDKKSTAAYAVSLPPSVIPEWYSAAAPKEVTTGAEGTTTYFMAYERSKTSKPSSTDTLVKPFYLYDGHLEEKTDKELKLKETYRMAMPFDNSINVHLVSEKFVEEHDTRRRIINKDGQVPEGGAEAELPSAHYTIDQAAINTDVVYGPWKNIFYSCYFTLTGVHGLHVVGGMIPITILLIQSLRGKLLPAHTEYVGLYWHFVDLVWIFLFPLLYLI